MGGGGQQSSQSGHSSTVPIIPPYLQALKGIEGQGLSGLEGAISGGVPSLSALYAGTPLQGVAGLSPEQLQTIQQYESLGTGGPNAPESTGLGTLTNYATGPIGQDPATQAAQQSFSQLTAPQIQQQAALQGRGNSGASLEAQALGQASTLAPFLQNAEAQQMSAGGQLIGAGGQLNTQQLNDMAAKLQAEGVPQQQAQQIANSLFQQQQQKFQFASGLQQQPLQLIPSLLGQSSVQVGSGSTSTK